MASSEGRGLAARTRWGTERTGVFPVCEGRGEALH